VKALILQLVGSANGGWSGHAERRFWRCGELGALGTGVPDLLVDALAAARAEHDDMVNDWDTALGLDMMVSPPAPWV